MSYRRLITIFLLLSLFWSSQLKVAYSNDVTSTELANDSQNTIDSSNSSTPILNSNLTSTPSNQTLKPLPYPFVVSIQTTEKGKYKHLCGGTILDAQFVLTAAHCTLKPRQLYAEDLTVAAGTDQLFGANTQRFPVRHLRKHPKFRPFYGHDILLLQLKKPIPIDNIRYAAIDFRNISRKGSNLKTLLIGWGRTVSGKPKNLQTVAFKTISNDICFIQHNFKYLTKSEICAVNSNGPRGACDGDSGGPLIDAEQHSLYGLLSYGRKPCEKGKPFAFTRISTNLKWIEAQMKNMLRQSAKHK